MSFPGNDLLVHRLEAGLSHNDVHRKLRIPASFVEAIESDNWETLPSPVYRVGFTKTYCEFLGLDPEPYVDAILSVKQARWKTLGFGASTDPVERPAWISDAIVWATIVLVSILGWASYTAVIPLDTGQSSNSVQAETLDFRSPRITGRQL